MRKKVIGRPVEDFECDCGDCKYENELDDQEIEEIKMIAEFTNAVIEANGCFECSFEILSRIYNIGKEIGWDDCRDMLVGILEDDE